MASNNHHLLLSLTILGVDRASVLVFAQGLSCGCSQIVAGAKVILKASSFTPFACLVSGLRGLVVESVGAPRVTLSLCGLSTWWPQSTWTSYVVAEGSQRNCPTGNQLKLCSPF